jgi:cell division septation protein DedD
MKRMLVVAIVCVMSVARLTAQQLNIENYVALVERGEGATIQAELPSLLNRYPNNPGVLYLQALLTTDGAEAARLYQNIVDNFPKSEWADDALFKVYRFYQAIGLYRTAEIKFNQLKTNYPNAKYFNEGATAETKTQQEQTPVETPKSEEPTTTVTATPSEPVRTETRIEEAPAAGKFALQVGVYSTLANANRQKSFFEYQKYAADIITKDRSGKELYVVRVGNYATAEEARIKGDEIKRSFNIDYLVVTR